MLASADSPERTISGGAPDGSADAQALPGAPTRSCRVCRKRKPKAELARWVVKAGELVRDERGSLPGRGWYSCSQVCAERLPFTLSHKRKRSR